MVLWFHFHEKVVLISCCWSWRYLVGKTFLVRQFSMTCMDSLMSMQNYTPIFNQIRESCCRGHRDLLLKQSPSLRCSVSCFNSSTHSPCSKSQDRAGIHVVFVRQKYTSRRMHLPSIDLGTAIVDKYRVVLATKASTEENTA